MAKGSGVSRGLWPQVLLTLAVIADFIVLALTYRSVFTEDDQLSL